MASPSSTALTEGSSSSSSSSPSQTNSNANSFGNAPLLGSSASLYLYTFLATLVLLLAISALIVLRASVLRRRQRALMEEAIRNGTYVPPASRIRTEEADKPVLYDVYLRGDDEFEDHSNADDGMEKAWREGKEVNGSMPVAVAAAGIHSPSPGSPSLQSPTSHPRYLRFLHKPTPTVTPSHAHGPEYETASPKPRILRIVYLVRMPASSLKKMEEAIPPMEFGIVTTTTVEPFESV